MLLELSIMENLPISHFSLILSPEVDGSLSNVSQLGLKSMGYSALGYYPMKTLKEVSKYINYEKIHEYQDDIKKSSPSSDLTETSSITRAFLKWFKVDFFKWISSPPCKSCNGVTTYNSMKMIMYTSMGREYNDRCELYSCAACPEVVTEFCRYNCPVKLMDSRGGRCGEFANAFSAILNAAGIKNRIVMDYTDHVWVEVFDFEQYRWVHADPCENAYDCPLMYEEGWGKKLAKMVAFDRWYTVDVTRRYTKKYYSEVKERGLTIERAKDTELQFGRTAPNAKETDEDLSLNTLNPEQEGEEEVHGKKWSLWLRISKLKEEMESRQKNPPPYSENDKDRMRFSTQEIRAEIEKFCGSVGDDEGTGGGERGGRETGDEDWKDERGENGHKKEIQ